MSVSKVIDFVYPSCHFLDFSFYTYGALFKVLLGDIGLGQLFSVIESAQQCRLHLCVRASVRLRPFDEAVLHDSSVKADVCY